MGVKISSKPNAGTWQRRKAALCRIPILYFISLTWMAMASVCAAQTLPEAVELADTLHAGKKAWDLTTAAGSFIQLTTLVTEIEEAYATDPFRYRSLNNQMAQESGWLAQTPEEDKYIELRPTKSPYNDYGYFSITLKKLTRANCILLSKLAWALPGVLQVDLNGMPVYADGKRLIEDPPCKSEWFFEDGKNQLKLIGR